MRGRPSPDLAKVLRARRLPTGRWKLSSPLVLWGAWCTLSLGWASSQRAVHWWDPFGQMLKAQAQGCSAPRQPVRPPDCPLPTSAMILHCMGQSCQLPVSRGPGAGKPCSSYKQRCRVLRHRDAADGCLEDPAREGEGPRWSQDGELEQLSGPYVTMPPPGHLGIYCMGQLPALEPGRTSQNAPSLGNVPKDGHTAPESSGGEASGSQDPIVTQGQGGVSNSAETSVRRLPHVGGNASPLGVPPTVKHRAISHPLGPISCPQGGPP